MLSAKKMFGNFVEINALPDAYNKLNVAIEVAVSPVVPTANVTQYIQAQLAQSVCAFTGCGIKQFLLNDVKLFIPGSAGRPDSGAMVYETTHQFDS